MSRIAKITVNAVWGHSLTKRPPALIGTIAEGDTLDLVVRWLTPDKQRAIKLSPDAEVYGHAAPRRSKAASDVVELVGSVDNAGAGKVLVQGDKYAMKAGAQTVQVRVVNGSEAVTFTGILEVTRSLMQKGS